MVTACDGSANFRQIHLGRSVAHLELQRGLPRPPPINTLAETNGPDTPIVGVIFVSVRQAAPCLQAPRGIFLFLSP
jgi:hypothetical protein